LFQILAKTVRAAASGASILSRSVAVQYLSLSLRIVNQDVGDFHCVLFCVSSGLESEILVQASMSFTEGSGLIRMQEEDTQSPSGFCLALTTIVNSRGNSSFIMTEPSGSFFTPY
jgi:hypothetical protein